MSVGFITMGKFAPAGGGGIDNGSDPYAHGGGVYPGALPPPRKHLEVTVRNVNSFNENVKIKVQISND